MRKTLKSTLTPMAAAALVGRMFVLSIQRRSGGDVKAGRCPEGAPRSARRRLTKRVVLTAGGVLAAAALPGCSRHETPTYQGYVEGEFVYLSSSQSGTLTQLAVRRGQAINSGASIFSLESENETAALNQAEQQ